MDNHEETSSRLYLSAEQSREVDRFAIDQLGISSLVLMENAGRGAADAIGKLLLDPSPFPASGEVCVTLLVGPGNNGGDGWVIARHLEARGVKPYCFLFGTVERLSPDNRTNLEILQRSGLAITHMESIPRILALDLLAKKLQQSRVIVDTLLGTGSKGSPREPMAEAIRLANRMQAWRVAIDLPTGLDTDSGIPNSPTFQAHRTLTMVTRKLGFKNPLASEYLGEVSVLSIGIPAMQLKSLLPI